MRLLITLIFCSLALNAQALESSPMINGKPWKQVGKGTYSVLLFDAYDIALYSPNGAYRATAPHALSIEYRMSFTKSEIVDRSIEEMERKRKLPESKRKYYIEQLSQIIPNVKEGDEIRAVFVPNKSTVFYKNGKRLGVIKDAAFTNEYSGIWLADDTNAPSLREDLIGAMQ